MEKEEIECNRTKLKTTQSKFVEITKLNFNTSYFSFCGIYTPFKASLKKCDYLICAIPTEKSREILEIIKSYNLK